MVRVVRVHIVARVAVVRRVGGGRGVARRRATQGPLPGMGVWEFLSIWFLFLFKFMILPGILQTTRSKETSEDLREHPGLFRELYKDLS